MICVIEISMSEEDGTYVFQQVVDTPSGRRVDRTLYGDIVSIPVGLRALANEIEQEALSEFTKDRP